MNYTNAKAIAGGLVLNLENFCTSIAIGGSLRRLKPVVKDIEIICTPIIEEHRDLFGNLISLRSRLEDIAWISWGKVIKNGLRYKQIELFQGINLDLFICLPPSHWGVLYTLRTGPDDFSRLCVTRRNLGGYLPSDCHVKDNQVWRGGTWVPGDIPNPELGHWEGGEVIPMPEESDFLKFLNLGWIPPEER